MAILFNKFVPQWFGHETLLYSAFKTQEAGQDVWRIPFLICMGWSFLFTVLVMIALSLSGPVVNARAFALDKSMFKLKPSSITLIILILLVLMGLYIRFW